MKLTLFAGLMTGLLTLSSGSAYCSDEHFNYQEKPVQKTESTIVKATKNLASACGHGLLIGAHAGAMYWLYARAEECFGGEKLNHRKPAKNPLLGCALLSIPFLNSAHKIHVHCNSAWSSLSEIIGAQKAPTQLGAPYEDEKGKFKHASEAVGNAIIGATSLIVTLVANGSFMQNYNHLARLKETICPDDADIENMQKHKRELILASLGGAIALTTAISCSLKAAKSFNKVVTSKKSQKNLAKESTNETY